MFQLKMHSDVHGEMSNGNAHDKKVRCVALIHNYSHTLVIRVPGLLTRLLNLTSLRTSLIYNAIRVVKCFCITSHGWI